MAYETKLTEGQGIKVSGACVIQVYDAGRVTIRIASADPTEKVVIDKLDEDDERLFSTSRLQRR
jgi:hypothetical protein